MEIKNLSDYTERELLEIIVSNQVHLAQYIFRVNDYLIEKEGKKFSEKIAHKDETFERLLESYNSLNRQIKNIND